LLQRATKHEPGGSYGTNVTTADKADYVAGSTAYAPNYNATQARANLAAAGNASFGIYMGGITVAGLGSGVKVATADKADYVAGSTSAAPAYNASQARDGLAAAGNASFGIYMAGAVISIGVIADKADYVAGITAAAPAYNASQATYLLAAAGNASFGIYIAVYFADKADYVAGFTAAAPAYNSSQIRSRSAAAGNASFGIYMAGSGPVTTADKADYVAGTTDAATAYNASQAREGLAAASTSNPGSI